MKKFALQALLCLVIGYTGNVYAQTDVLTQHNDNNRTGWNNQETSLNTNNVKIGSFGKKFTCAVDGQIYAQPLVVSGVNVPGHGIKNVVYVATVNNTLYAFDADDGTQYWFINFTTPGFRPPQNTDIHSGLCGPNSYNDFSGKFGITGTPVIDKAAGKIYLVYREADPNTIDNSSQSERAYSSTGFYCYLAAVDIASGVKLGGTLIATSVTATGEGNVSGVISFDPRRNLQRSGLLLLNGMIYIPFAAHCDWNSSHGWILGYDASTLAKKLSYITTPNDGLGGIWMSGGGPAADGTNIYVASGNGHDLDFKTSTPINPAITVNRGESVIKLTPNAPGNTATALNITDFFTPKNFKFLNDGDLDLPIQVMLIPNTNLVVTGAKDGNLYVMTTSNLGGYSSTTNNLFQPEVPVGGGTNAQMHSSFAYFGGNTTKYFYQFSENTALQAFPVTAAGLGTTPVTSGISGPTGASGAYMSSSSNGGDPATGILWINHAVTGCNANQTLCTGVLRAVNASNVQQELWNSGNVGTDNFGIFAKTVCPTVANGKVYMASNSNMLVVYGLTGADPCAGLQNVALHSVNAAAMYSATTGTAANAFDGNTGTSWAAPDNASITLDLSAKYDICKIAVHWGNLNTTEFSISGSNTSPTTGYTVLEDVQNNTSPDHTLYVQNQGYRYIQLTLLHRNDFMVNHLLTEMEVYGQLSNPCSTPTGITWTNINENSGTLSWTSVAGATGYTIQYKTTDVVDWKTVNVTGTSVNLSALTCNTSYLYRVQATCASGSSAIASGSFLTGNCTSSCTTFNATRYHHADIGNIGLAGSSCFENLIYTIQGSGADIGGTADAFQYVYANFAGDEEVTTRIASQDNTNPFNKAGIMMRDVLSSTSRYVFVGLTSGHGVAFSYRSTDGGTAVTSFTPGYTTPYYLKLKKLGTTYTAFVSPTGVGNSWTLIGTATPGFGSGTVNVGLAVTSADNTKLSTAVIDNYVESSSPLPIRLISFTASNMNNEYVSLHWVTALEQNNSHFDVERSTDNLHFEKIITVQGAENSTVNKYYEAEDDQPANGLNFYRLRQVDNDGKSTYSPIVSVQFGNQMDPTVFPNPVTSFFTVIAGKEAIKNVELFNVSGKLLQRISNDAGNSNITVITANLASGVYVVKIRTASKIYQEKIIKQ